MPEGSLTSRQRALVGVSAALAARDHAGLRAALEAAARDAEPGEVDEVILQSHLFLGYPAALEGFSVWRRIAPEGPEPLVEDHETCARRGDELGRTVYGRPWERLRDNVRELHPDLERWMVEEGYGRVLGRPGLDLLERELCVAALLAVLDLPRQLYAHARGALRVGASPEQVAEALAVAHDMSGPAARQSARETWRAVCDRFVRESRRRN